MFGVTEAIERQLVKLVKVIVGTIVAAGSLTVLYSMYDATAVVLAVMYSLGLVHLLVEYRETRGDRDAPAA